MLTTFAPIELPPPESIRRTAEEVVRRSYFDLGDGSGGTAVPFWWRILRWVIKPFKWLFDAMEGWPDWVRWAVVVVCVILLIALVSHIVYTFAAAIRGPAARRRQRYDAAHVEIDPAELEHQADVAGSGGDYIGAVRALFRAALRRIEVAEKKKLRPGFTNRELLRRYRSSGLFQSLERFVDTIDAKWYGGQACLQEDYVNCRQEYARIREYVEAARAANGA